MGMPLASGPIFITALETASADETLGVQVDMSRFGSGVFYIVPAGTVTSGVVSIEESAIANYTGTWSLVTASGTVATDAQQALHLNVAANSYKYVRARISTAIGGGGTVKVYLQAN